MHCVINISESLKPVICLCLRNVSASGVDGCVLRLWVVCVGLERIEFTLDVIVAVHSVMAEV